MTDWVKVTNLQSLMRLKKQVVSVNGENIVLFYLKGEVFAMLDACVHKQKSLSKGLIFKGNVICPGHQWAFDLKTGWVDEWSTCQPTYQVMIEDGEVFIDPESRVYTSAPKPCERYQ